ncbi:MAG TPA: hypothetical protein VNL17_08680 [Verrucomicrobiae bacterium]|nr:hypothetical protein [Verrucomicrobiae bacterium]
MKPSKQPTQMMRDAAMLFTRQPTRTLTTALTVLSFFVILHSSFAGNVFPFRIISGSTTAEVDETQFGASDITLTVTNLPGGGRRANIGIIGGGGSGSGITNVLDTAGGTYGLVGHTNQPTLLIKGLTNQTPALITITDFGTMLGFSVATQSGFGSTNAWTTNGLPWTVSDTFGFSNASSVVNLAFTNLGGVPTIYLVPDSTIARTGQSQTWSAPQTLNTSATLTLSAPTWFKNSVTVSDNVTIVSNAAVGGNATISGNVNAGSFTGSMGGGNITGNQSIGTNVLAAFGSNTGTIGSAGQFLVVHLNSAGIPDGWSTVTGNSLATSTNSISAVQLGGSWNNGVIAASFSNFSIATINGTTVTVGFASLPFENITVLNGTTNFTLHGSSLTISNILSDYGVTLTNRGIAQIDLGGKINMISNSAGIFIKVSGSASAHTNTFGSSDSGIQTFIFPVNASGVQFGLDATVNGVTPQAKLVVQDGSNQQFLEFTRDGAKAGAQFISFLNSSAVNGHASFGLEPSGNANGDKLCINISTATSGGGLIIVNQDDNSTGLSGYQFYENDPRFPRILLGDGKAQVNTNTPHLHETYASYGNWTNQAGRLDGGALIVIGSNENWLVACGRAMGSVSGTKDKEYPTNHASGFLAGGLSTAASNQTFMVVRDQTNGLWCIGVDTNGVLGAYRTNDLSTTVLTY